MKTLLVALSFCLVSQTASAKQFEIFVSQANQVTPSQELLGSLVQKNILIDTTKKVLRLQLSSLCDQNSFCNEALVNANFKIESMEAIRGKLTYIQASGMLKIKGNDSFTMITITLNPNHSTDIIITNDLGCKSMSSSFVGSPASLTSILF